MSGLLEGFTFLLGAYWPFMAFALLVGLVTGWLSLGKPGDGAL